jgi:hypothetical protein
MITVNMITAKDWVDILQALLTPTVAVFGLIIAYRQWRINKVRLKHELYDRRMAVYTKLIDYLSVIFSGGHFNNEAFIGWLNKSYEGYFLFNDELIKYFEAINEKSRALKKIHRNISLQKETGKKGEQPQNDLSKQEEELQQWFEKQLNVAKDKFSQFLRIDA